MIKKDNNHLTMGLGIPTLLMLFVLLGMIIISALTYLYQMSNTKIVEKEVEYVSNYYETDAKAKYIIDSKDEEFIKQNVSTYDYDLNHLKFIISIDDKHELRVSVNNDTVEEYYVASKEAE